MVALTLVVLLVIGMLVGVFVRSRRTRSLGSADGQARLTLRDPVGVLRVLRVEPKRAGADDRRLLRVHVRPAAGLEVEGWVTDSLRPDTLVEVFDRAA